MCIVFETTLSWGETALSWGETTLSWGETTLSWGETTLSWGETDLGQNDRNSFDRTGQYNGNLSPHHFEQLFLK